MFGTIEWGCLIFGGYTFIIPKNPTDEKLVEDKI
jgi:hypothetical protein